MELFPFERGAVGEPRSSIALGFNEKSIIVLTRGGGGGLILLASSFATTSSRQGVGLLGQRARVWSLFPQRAQTSWTPS